VECQDQKQTSQVVGTTILGLLTQTVGTILTMLECMVCADGECDFVM